MRMVVRGPFDNVSLISVFSPHLHKIAMQCLSDMTLLLEKVKEVQISLDAALSLSCLGNIRHFKFTFVPAKRISILNKHFISDAVHLLEVVNINQAATQYPSVK